MKQILFTLLIISPLMLSAQYSDDNKQEIKPANRIELENAFPVKDGKIYYTEIIQTTDSIAKEVIYSNLKSAITSTMQSNAPIIQSEDLNSGSIVARAFIVKGHNSYIKDPKIWFSFKVDVKDNKYRYVLTNVVYDFSVTVSTSLYASTINTYQNINKPLEEWVQPDKRVSKNVKKAMEKWLIEVDAEFKKIIEQVKTKAQTQEQEW